jgi:18S rRNA (guanine1575-N7)-methyltransferase
MDAIPKNEIDDDEEDEKVDVVRERRKLKKQKYHESKYKSREWILKKKSRQRKQGKDVRLDTKYTGRRRPWHAF